MTPELWHRLKPLFHAALEENAQDRAAFVDSACGDDLELKRHLKELLDAEEQKTGSRDARFAQLNAAFQMPLAGQKLGPYVIVSPLGRGGMGEVWRARDSRLGRDVAIKISHQQFSDRFEREARAIAALNHPNICTLHDVGPNYLVMEIVEGPTLAERISNGPMPVDEALVLVGQIAAALDAAHEKGIIHRDLKPANIKIRPDGSVKVLDFGLAKSVVDPAKVSSDSPTEWVSAPGAILGTAAYMSPEQARGHDVDKRSDIWAFGVVLFEMTTCKRLFERATVTDCLAAILKDNPDLTEAPPKIQRLLASCLEKDAPRRLRDIGDWQRLLEPVSSAAPQSRRSNRERLAWLAAGVAAVLLLVSLVRGAAHPRKDPPAAAEVRFQIPAPDKLNFFVYSMPAVSPDGERIAFTATANNADYDRLFIRPLNATSATEIPVPGFDIRFPFWSPDGRQIAFATGGPLLRVDVSGGLPVTICNCDAAFGGTWNRDGVIISTSRSSRALLRVSAAGGDSKPLRTLAEGETAQLWARFLPRWKPLPLSILEHSARSAGYLRRFA